MLAAIKYTFAEHPWTVGLAFCGFVLVWLGAMKFVAWKSGWSELAKRFRESGQAGGKSSGFCSIGSSRKADYRGCMKVGVSDSALHLSGQLAMRPFHPPLAIPWREVTGIVSHPLQADWGGVAFSGTQLVLYFHEIQLAEIRDAWERHRRATELAHQ